MSKKAHIITAYAFNIVMIIMSFALMESYVDGLLTSYIVLGCVYLLYWIVCNRKKYMPWSVYCQFCVGVLVQILLNLCRIIPEDGGWFSGLGQFFYIILVIIHALLIGFTNLILYLIDRKRIARCK